MLLGDVDSYMSVNSYVAEAYKRDSGYANYVKRSAEFVDCQLKRLNLDLARRGKSEYAGEVRVRNSDVVNAEVSSFVFYISSGVFSAFYRVDFFKYYDVFNDQKIKKVIRDNPVELPFQFVIFHELGHIYRSHVEVENDLVGEELFVKATEMDADLLAVGKLYRTLQNVFSDRCSIDLELRCLALITVMEVLCIASLHSGGVYQSESQRLLDIIVKLSHLNENPDPHVPVDVDCSSDVTRRNNNHIVKFILNLRRKLASQTNILEFIDRFLKYVVCKPSSDTFSSWEKIKHDVGKISDTNV